MITTRRLWISKEGTDVFAAIAIVDDRVGGVESLSKIIQGRDALWCVRAWITGREFLAFCRNQSSVLAYRMREIPTL